MGKRVDVDAMVEAVTVGLDGQRMTDLLRDELARRLEAYLAGDRTAGVQGPEPSAPRRTPCIRYQVAQAIAVATAGRVRPVRRFIRSGHGAADWHYSGSGSEDWAEVLDEVGHAAVAAHVERLLNGPGGIRWKVGFGVGRRSGRTLTVTWVA